MTRRRFIQQPGGELVEVSPDYVPEPKGPLVFGDLPEYQSPVTGMIVAGRRARREDLKRTRSRPWEGLQQEKKEAARQQEYKQERINASLTRAASEAYYQLPPSKRAILRGN